MNKWSFIDEKFKKHKLQYAFQSGLATVSVFLFLIFLDTLKHPTIIATLGSAAFVIFTMPHAYISKQRVLTGAHIIGIIVGCSCSTISNIPQLVEFMGIEWAYTLFGGLSVGLSIFLMVITNTEHPPAAGMALGLVLNEWDAYTLLFIMLALTVMIILKKALRPKLINLI